MAFTREFVRNLAKESDIEIPKEFLDGLMDEHIKARDAYSEAQVKTALDGAPKAEDFDPKKTEEYRKLKQEFETYKGNIEAEKTIADKKAAYRILLKAAGVAENRLDSILRVTDFSKIELDGNGAIKGEKELSDKIKTEWADFVVQTVETGATTSNPPANNTGSGKSRDEIMQIKDTSERQRAIAEALQKGEM